MKSLLTLALLFLSLSAIASEQLPIPSPLPPPEWERTNGSGNVITSTNMTPDLKPVPAPIPEGCGQEGIAFKDGQLILGTGNIGSLNEPVYLIQNNSDYPQISLTRSSNHPMSAAWVSRLDMGQWSAITLSHRNFVLNCMGRKPGAIGFVDCSSVLAVCSFPHANISSGGGHLWIGENRALLDILTRLRELGATIP